MEKQLNQPSHRVLVLIEIANLLCFVSLFQMWFRGSPSFVVLMSLTIGCLTNVIMFRFDKNMRFISKVLAAFYIINIVGIVSYLLSGG
jgi:hypothetical protein